MSKHAILSASSAHRWLRCTPSARLEQRYPDTQSESASEGTFAHAYAEITLQKYLKQITASQYDTQIEKMKENEFWSNALVGYVDKYVDYVLEMYSEAQTYDTGAALLLEQHLDFSKYVPQGFGRGDAVIIADDNMHIIDLKYGKNVQVRAENNPQLRLYALGAIQELSCLYEISSVTMSIVQPRNGGISSEKLTVEELEAWGDKTREIANVAITGGGELVAGEHCRFCKAAPRCREMAKMAEAVSTDTKVEELSDTEVSEVLAKAENIISWLHKVQDFALTEARDNGAKWPGFKLVEGRSNRKYSDESVIMGTLIFEGWKAEEICKPQSLIGITDMEKLLGKKEFNRLLSGFIIKPPGKPTLVPESDKRPEWTNVDEFEDLDK